MCEVVRERLTLWYQLTLSGAGLEVTLQSK